MANPTLLNIFAEMNPALRRRIMPQVSTTLRKNATATLLFLSVIFGVLSCSSDESNIEGYFRYTAGQAYLQVSRDENGSYRVGNSTGELVGELKGDVIQGVTELNDSFSMEVRGDSAIYTIFGIPSVYYRITAAEFEK